MGIKPSKIDPAAIGSGVSPYKVIKEEPTHFVVSHDADPTNGFRVAKFGLGAKTLASIRARMDDPGVQHLAGGDTPETIAQREASTGPALPGVGPLDLVQNLLTPSDDPNDRMSPEDYKNTAFVRGTQSGGSDVVAPTVPHIPAQPLGDVGTASQPTFPTPDSNPDEGAGVYQPGWQDAKNNGASMQNAREHPEQYPLQPEKKPGVGTGGADYNGMGEVNRRTKQYEAGQKMWAAEQERLGNAQAAIQQGYIDQQKAIAAKAEQDRASMTAKIDQTVNDIKNFKIDPERHWGTGNTAVINKTMAGIGMIIAGIGNNNGGQNNMAMQVINKAIDRDIDAQKTDLANKNNLVNIYFKQYGNINDAETRAKLDLHANVQAQLDMALAKAKGPLAQAEIQKQMAEHGLEMVKLRDTLVNSQAHRSLMKVQEEHLRAQAALDLYKAKKDAQAAQLPVLRVGGTSYVQDPTMQTVRPETVDKARQSINYAGMVVDSTNRMLKLIGPDGKVSPTDFETAKKLGVEMLQLLDENSLANQQGVVREDDARRIREALGNPAKLFTLGASNIAGLRTLRDSASANAHRLAKGVNLIPVAGEDPSEAGPAVAVRKPGQK